MQARSLDEHPDIRPLIKAGKLAVVGALPCRALPCVDVAGWLAIDRQKTSYLPMRRHRRGVSDPPPPPSPSCPFHPTPGAYYGFHGVVSFFDHEEEAADDCGPVLTPMSNGNGADL